MELRDESSQETSLQRQQIPSHRERRQKHSELREKIEPSSEAADSVFYIREGKVKVTVGSDQGKEAVVAVHGKGDFFGEGSLNGQSLRLASAVAMADSTIMRITKAAVVRVLREQ